MHLHVTPYAAHAKWFHLALVIAATGVGACRSPAADPLVRVTIAAPRDHFARSGFAEMVPPLRLPLRSLRHRTEVWLKIPDGERITTRALGGRTLLELPPGSEAARVEMTAGRDLAEREEHRVADVRGTRFERTGEAFFVLRPVDTGLDAPLEGWRWRRDSKQEQSIATERMAELAARLLAPEARSREAAAIRKSNDCAGCHQHAREANVRFREHGIANRGTDASGCYQVQGVLLSHLPLESYFPVETNLEDPFVRFDCGSDETVARRKNRKVTCPDGTVPQGRLDVRSALRAGDAHAYAVCKSRRYLFERLDAKGREAFRAGFEECGLEAPLSQVSRAAPSEQTAADL